ncbi:MAG: calcium-binding protein, partial [Shimia sp.]|nr:calcium-binding protein [Shimia sp.]
DTLNGAAGSDSLDGGDGADQIRGDAGADTILGGEGNDFLYGQEGNDDIFGGDGRDYLFQDRGYGTLDGGAGDDYIYASTDSSVNNATQTLIGGAGNDVFYNVGRYSVDTVDAGADNDTVNLNGYGYSATRMGGAIVTLGAGADRLLLGANTTVNAFVTFSVTDFNVSEDVFDFDSFLEGSRITGWDGASNPFGAAGYFQFLNDGLGNTLFQVDTNGGGDNFVTVVTFEGLAPGDFLPTSFVSDWDPSGAAPVGVNILGTASSETFTGSTGADAIIGEGGNDYIYGEAGNDVLTGGAGSDNIFGGVGSDSIT